jgi:hypothetical protein
MGGAASHTAGLRPAWRCWALLASRCRCAPRRSRHAVRAGLLGHGPPRCVSPAAPARTLCGGLGVRPWWRRAARASRAGGREATARRRRRGRAREAAPAGAAAAAHQVRGAAGAGPAPGAAGAPSAPRLAPPRRPVLDPCTARPARAAERACWPSCLQQATEGSIFTAQTAWQRRRRRQRRRRLPRPGAARPLIGLLTHAAAQGSTQVAAEAEAALQRQLARKLGIKGAKRRALADAAGAATAAAAHGPNGGGGAGAPWAHGVGRERCHGAGRPAVVNAWCLSAPGSSSPNEANSGHNAEAGF